MRAAILRLCTSLVPAAFVLIGGSAWAVSEFTDGNVGMADPVQPAPLASHSNRKLPDDGRVERGWDAGVFDFSDRVVPWDQLPVRPATPSTPMSLDEMTDGLRTESVTSDGKVEIFEISPDLKSRILDGIRSIEEERRSGLESPADPFAHSIRAPAGDQLGSSANAFFVFGADRRKRITATSEYPYRTIGFLGPSGCSGSLVGPRHVLTAGHCVFNIKQRKWYRNMRFYPGLNGETMPYGSIDVVRQLSVTGWTQQHQPQFDFGMVVLAQDAGVGWMGYGYDEPMPKYNINVIGYPGSKPKFTMWHSYCPLERSDVHALHYRCAATAGMSGGPVYVHWRQKTTNDQNKIVGMHAYEYRDGSRPNWGPRIDKGRYERISEWKRQF